VLCVLLCEGLSVGKCVAAGDSPRSGYVFLPRCLADNWDTEVPELAG